MTKDNSSDCGATREDVLAYAEAARLQRIWKEEESKKLKEMTIFAGELADILWRKRHAATTVQEIDDALGRAIQVGVMEYRR